MYQLIHTFASSSFVGIHSLVSVRTTFHLTIFMRGQRARGKIQRNNYHHGKNVVGVFDLHAPDASECQKSLSEK